MTTRSAPTLDRLITLHIPGPETVNDYGERIPGPDTDIRVWASRRDTPVADQLDLDSDQRLRIRTAVFTLRYRPDVAIDQMLTDDGGLTWRIIGGPHEVGRLRHMQILAEVIR